MCFQVKEEVFVLPTNIYTKNDSSINAVLKLKQAKEPLHTVSVHVWLERKKLALLLLHRYRSKSVSATPITAKLQRGDSVSVALECKYYQSSVADGSRHNVSYHPQTDW